MIYHLKVDINLDKFKRSDIELILFLSRMLSEIEIKYWSTELKMCDFVWVVRRVRHMIETIKNTIVMFTDYAINIFIVKQITMNSSNTNKFNLRLVRVSIYLSQFRFEMKYKSEKNHIVFDVLFRLTSKNEEIERSLENIFDFDNYHEDIVDLFDDSNCYVFQDILIVMSKKFKKEIKNDYQQEKMWRNMIAMLKSLTTRVKKKNKNLTIQFSLFVEEAVNNENINEQDENDAKSIFKKLRTNINFALNENEIIYHIDDDSRRSCISIFVKRKIFRLAHDENYHSEVHRNYDKISSILYIFRLFKKIRKYIEYCSICQLIQTKRHRLYDELMSIISTSRFFHIIAIDFIFVLFDELNITMFVTCKHFRRISLIFDKETYKAKKWVNALLNRFLITDWDISKAIIFDRDFKFMSDLWQIFFIRLNTRLLVVIAYHSQIDEVFERTNQIVEITIRYFIIEHSNIDYVLAFSSIQVQLNNSLNTVTDLASNEMIYDFKIKNALFSITKVNIVNAQDLSIQRLKYQRKTIDVIVFATTKVKIYYDVRHTSILFEKDEYVYLRLNKEYKLSKRLNSKLSQQRCEFFKILQRVERLTYKLNLSSTWRVHSVIFIVQLKLVFVDFDSY